MDPNICKPRSALAVSERDSLGPPYSQKGIHIPNLRLEEPFRKEGGGGALGRSHQLGSLF